jgi:hypothetical protein
MNSKEAIARVVVVPNFGRCGRTPTANYLFYYERTIAFTVVPVTSSWEGMR